MSRPPQLRSVLSGAALSLPWALANLAAGSELIQQDAIQQWWQPLRAFQPSLAEEAWGRALMVPFLVLLFSGSARAGVGLRAAVRWVSSGSTGCTLR